MIHPSRRGGPSETKRTHPDMDTMTGDLFEREERVVRVDAEIAAELEDLDAAGLLRRLRVVEPGPGPRVRIGGREVIQFCSNDYLGLSRHEELRGAMMVGVARYGVGAGASRLVSGSLAAHDELEQALAEFKGTAAALAFGSGHAAALGTVPALCGADDIVILDKLSHASLIDAAKLSGATLRVFPHNNLQRLSELLKAAREKSGNTRILVITESVFSMDGDSAPLREIVELCERSGAMLLVDEAHAVGVLGPEGRGLVAQLGLEGRVPLQMGTLSKAVGVCGGYIAASRPVVDLLINKARSLIYTTAPPPAVAFAARRALELVRGPVGGELRARLHENIGLAARALGLWRPAAGIVPIILGEESVAMRASAELLDRGFLIPAIRHPTVARGRARLRLTLSALHEAGQIEGLVASLHHAVPELRAAAEHASQKRS